MFASSGRGKARAWVGREGILGVRKARLMIEKKWFRPGRVTDKGGQAAMSLGNTPGRWARGGYTTVVGWGKINVSLKKAGRRKGL